MKIFLIIFLTIYTLMHAGFFFRMRPLFAGKPIYGMLFFIVLLQLILSPMVERLLEKTGHFGSAKIVGAVAFTWMGMIFLFFCLDLLLRIAELATGLIGIVLKKKIDTGSWARKAGALCLTVLALSLYASYEAGRLKVETIVIPTKKLPPPEKRIRIALISDLHIDLGFPAARLETILNKIRPYSPDLLVCAGDIVDGHIPDQKTVARLFRSVDFPLGKFAVIGNHEVYNGLEKSIDFMTDAGFTLLRGRIHQLPRGIRIAGIDDPTAGVKIPFFRDIGPESPFTILVSHRPMVTENLTRFDLQLSGHTHGGQIFPFHFAVARAFPYYRGLHRLNGGHHLYVSRGSGTWGPQMRLGSPPEITIIDIEKKS